MKKSLTILCLVAGMLGLFSSSVQAQEDKYKAIQGLGYLHTQVTIIIDNWEVHPLNHKPMDQLQEEFQQHFLEELEHDEEWVEFMLVEDNLLFQFEDHISVEVEDAIESNLEFYGKVIKTLKRPEEVDAMILDWKADMEAADSRLYDIIYPALCK